MNALLGRIAASACIITVSALVIYHACVRSSTIYFFELDSTSVFFVSIRHAVAFPIGLSVLLVVVHYATKRAKFTELRRQEEEEETRRKAAAEESSSASRKVSRTSDLRPIFEVPSGGGEADIKTSVERLKRMLSDIEEQHDADASSSPLSASLVASSARTSMESADIEERIDEEKRKRIIDPDTDNKSDVDADELEMGAEAGRRSRTNSSSMDRPPSTSRPPTVLVAAPSDASLPGSRKSSIGSRTGLVRLSRRNSVGSADEMRPCDLYRELGQIDLMTYIVNALSIVPRGSDRDSIAAMKKSIRISDIIADLIAVHVPVWACVAALHIVLLEAINVKFAFYFYYHEETMAYAALISAMLFGLLHEFAGGWLSTDVLALASVYVVVSRVQLVSFQTGVALSVGLIAFDLFFIYVVDLLSVVTKESRAPLMLLMPRDNEGGKQSLATLDIMAPGVFLNVLLKFNAMYDPKVFATCFQAAVAGLTATMAAAIWRKKITPALVLPLLSIIAAALITVDRPYDLWRFMIKH